MVQSTIDDSDVKQQMTIVENGVNYNIKRFNDLKVLNGRLTKVLKAKLDELEYEKKTYENLDAMKKAQTEEGMRIESLHSEIKQVEEEIRDRVHYSRKLDHILGRLKKNQLKYDAHMTGLEDTMRAIRKEEAEIRLMRRSLDAGLAKALLVLEETRSKYVTAGRREAMFVFGFILLTAVSFVRCGVCLFGAIQPDGGAKGPQGVDGAARPRVRERHHSGTVVEDARAHED